MGRLALITNVAESYLSGSCVRRCTIARYHPLANGNTRLDVVECSMLENGGRRFSAPQSVEVTPATNEDYSAPPDMNKRRLWYEGEWIDFVGSDESFKRLAAGWGD